MRPPNCCKRLTKRRLFARTAIAVLEQSTLGGRRGSRTAISIRRENRAAVSVAVFSRFAIYANVVSPTTKPRSKRDLHAPCAYTNESSCGDTSADRWCAHEMLTDTIVIERLGSRLPIHLSQ